MQNRTGKKMATGAVALGVALLVGTTSHAADYEWTNTAGDNDYMNVNNWAINGVPAGEIPPETNTTAAAINLTGIDRCMVVDGQVTPNINEFQIGYAADGEMEQTGGAVSATKHVSRITRIGWNGYNGLYTLSGGSATLNTVRLGAGGGTGTMLINGGSLNIARVVGDSSLLISSSSSTGTVEISSGGLTTRAGVTINTGGTFSLVGGDSVFVGIGSLGADGSWTQTEGSTLKVQVAANGIAAIEVNELDGDPASGNNGVAIFGLDSELDVSFLDGYEATNAWTIMEADGGFVDNGLKFAASVDTNNWEMIMTSNKLWVTYGGASILPPASTTNLLVDVEVTTPDTWNLFAPEGGSTALANQSSSGFTATIGTVVESDYRPAVAQEFNSDLDISLKGQSVTINFDVELLSQSITQDVGFRFALYDTNTNYQMTLGMLDMGVPAGTAMKVRFDPEVSRSDQVNFAFVPGDYSHMCGGGGTLAQSGDFPGNGLQYNKGVIHVEASVTRTSSNELEIATTWSSGTDDASLVFSFNELSNGDDVPPSGKWNQLNGFGIKLYNDAPFSSGVGSYQISNYELSYIGSLPVGYSYNISGFTVEPSGDLTLNLTDPIVGAMYTVLATTDLVLSDMVEIGSYMAEAPGMITIPAADAAPYMTGIGFFDVALPVTAVVELED